MSMNRMSHLSSSIAAAAIGMGGFEHFLTTSGSTYESTYYLNERSRHSPGYTKECNDRYLRHKKLKRRAANKMAKLSRRKNRH